MKDHPLTSKICKHHPVQDCHCNKIIVEYLESKVDRLKDMPYVGMPVVLVRQILDLEPKEEKIDEIQAEFSDGSTGDTLKRKLNELIRAVNELRSK